MQCFSFDACYHLSPFITWRNWGFTKVKWLAPSQPVSSSARAQPWVYCREVCTSPAQKCRQRPVTCDWNQISEFLRIRMGEGRFLCKVHINSGPQSPRERPASQWSGSPLKLYSWISTSGPVGILSWFIKTYKPISDTFPWAITSWRQVELPLTGLCRKWLEMVVIAWEAVCCFPWSRASPCSYRPRGNGAFLLAFEFDFSSSLGDTEVEIVNFSFLSTEQATQNRFMQISQPFLY